MSFQRIRDRLLRLPLHNKVVMVGAFLAAISVFMPWYQDLDAFDYGETFIGIEGPLYLAGFVILLASLVSFGLILFKVIDKKVPRLPMTESHTHIAMAVLNLFLLLLVNSVYFHDQFGVNIALKDSRFGMVVVFIGSALLLVGGVLTEKSKSPDLNVCEGRLEPLIDMHKKERTQREIVESSEKAVDAPTGQPVVNAKSNQTGVGNNRSHLYGNSSGGNKKGSPQPWRTDL